MSYIADVGDEAALENAFGPRELFSAVSQAANRSDLGILVTLWGSNPIILYVNEALTRLTGHHASELLHKSPWPLVAEGELTRLKLIYDERLRGKRVPQKLMTRLRHRSGREIPIELSATPVGVAGSMVSVFFVLDVSEQERAEEELRNSEARFAQLLDCAPDGVLMLDRTRVVTANRLAASMFGEESSGALVGRDVTAFLDARSAQSVTAHFEKLTVQGSGAGEREANELTTLAGRNLEVSAIPLDYEGQPTVLAFLRDVTERKAIQQRLVQADRLAAVGMLAAGVAHEINNPLTYVLLNLKYIQKELPKVAHQPERLEKLLQHLQDANYGAERVQTIVRDLRSFARADDEAPEPVELNAILDSSLAMADHELRRKASLHLHLAAVAYVCATPTKLEQVFLNVLMNAAQSLPTTARDNEIHVELTRPAANTVRVTVSDTGSGIPEDLREKVFEPFFTTKPRGMGTGLGLPICRNIIDSFGGRIWITPHAGRGTSVHVELPEVPRPEAFTPHTSSSTLPAAEAKRGRVLIIDDEKSVATMLARFLESNYDVKHCTGAADALDLLSRHTFDVILCDIMMPEMSGIDLFERLEHVSPGAQERVVFMTGGGLLPEVYDFLRSAERPKLEKPFDMGELRRVIQSVTRS